MTNNVTAIGKNIDSSDFGKFLNEHATRLNLTTPQILVPAGLTQGTATAITSRLVLLNVVTTLSTRGIKLPVPITGMEILVANGGSFGAKVYPSTGCRIGAALTNVADTTLAANKTNRYIAINSKKWAVERGA